MDNASDGARSWMAAPASTGRLVGLIFFIVGCCSPGSAEWNFEGETELVRRWDAGSREA